MFDISNKKRLGLSEVALVQEMIDGVKALIEAEKMEPDLPEEPAGAEAEADGTG